MFSLYVLNQEHTSALSDHLWNNMPAQYYNIHTQSIEKVLRRAAQWIDTT